MTYEEALDITLHGKEKSEYTEMVAEALEKQIAKKVNVKRHTAFCPHCGAKLTDTFFIVCGVHWCSLCGNAIDWDGEE